MTASRGDHWQRMYLYDEPWTIQPDTELAVTCDLETPVSVNLSNL